MSKHQLPEGAVLCYTGKPFDGYLSDEPRMIFLGYDSNGWTNIWVDYRGETRLVSLIDIEIVTE